jgi:hypothetical protein
VKSLFVEELNWSREERLRLERVAVGRICGCKSCLCCEELKRDTEQRKIKNAVTRFVMNTKIEEV